MRYIFLLLSILFFSEVSFAQPAPTKTDAIRVFMNAEDSTAWWYNPKAGYKKFGTGGGVGSFDTTYISTRINSKQSQFIINVKDYGAVGDGETQDSVAVKAAIAAAKLKGGGIVFFPNGQYKLPPIKLPSNVNLLGEGATSLAWQIGGGVDVNKSGSVLLINGVTGVSCLKFDTDLGIYNKNSGLKNLSIYNTNTDSVRSVVEIGDVSLYPTMENVQIGCITTNKGDGLLINGSVLYGNYKNVQVNAGGFGGGSETSVGYALHIKSTGPGYVPNANTFIGGHFIGKKKSLFVEAPADQKVFGVQFLGTSFESEYNALMEHEYLPEASVINGIKPGRTGYAIKWITVQAASGMVFSGCYFELGGYPLTYNDSTNGLHDVFPAIELGANTSYIDIKHVVPISRILDRGLLNQTTDALRIGDENNFNLIKSLPDGSISTLQFFTNASTHIGNTPRLKISNDRVIINGLIEAALPEAGTDDIPIYYDTTTQTFKKAASSLLTQNRLVKWKDGRFQSILAEDASDGVYYFKPIIGYTDLTAVGQGQIVATDAATQTKLEIGAGTISGSLRSFIQSSQGGVSSIRPLDINPNGGRVTIGDTLYLRNVNTGSSSDSILVISGGGVKQIAPIDSTTYSTNYRRDTAIRNVRSEIDVTIKTTSNLDFPSITEGSYSDLTVTVTGAASADYVELGIPSDAVGTNFSYVAWVSNTDVVTVRLYILRDANDAATYSIDPASKAFRIKVTKP